MRINLCGSCILNAMLLALGDHGKPLRVICHDHLLPGAGVQWAIDRARKLCQAVSAALASLGTEREYKQLLEAAFTFLLLIIIGRPSGR